MGARRIKLIEARKRQGLGRLALSNRIGITHQFVARVEDGERDPSIQTMTRWADALGISMDDFREDDEPCATEPRATVDSANAPPQQHYLRKWRVARGFTQGELGNLCGVSGATISHYEKGERSLRLNLQFELCKHLGISPGQFFVPPEDVLVNAVDRNQSQSAA